MSCARLGLVAALVTTLSSSTALAVAIQPGSTRVAVFDVVGHDVDKSVLTQLSEMIGGEIAFHNGYDVIGVNDVRRLAAATESQPRTCTRNDACIDQVARALHADLVITGSVARSGSEYELRLELGRTGDLANSTQTFATVKRLKSLPDTLSPCLENLFRWTDSEPPPAPPPPSRPHVGGAALVGPPAPIAAPQRRRVMVLDLRASGLDPKSIAPLAGLAAEEIARHAGYEVASPDDVSRILAAQQQKHAAGCDEDEACLTEISRKLDADLIVTGSVGLIGHSYVMNLTLIDTRAMGKARGSSDTVAQLDDLTTAIGPSLGRLFLWKGGEAAAPAFHLPKGKKLSFALLDLKPTGISAETAQNLTQVLSVEVKGVEGASVVGREDITAMLQLSSTKMAMGCEDDSCMAEIGGALGVDRLIAGDAGKLGGTFIINLRLIDVRAGRVENRVNESFRGDEEQLLRAVRHAGRALLGLTVTGAGRLAVTASQTTAEVSVDDVQRGRAPIAVTDLSVGPHDVRVTRGGFFDWQSDVYIDPSETTAVWAQLSARPQAWYEKWWIWAIAGGVVAGVTVTSVVATRPPPTVGHGTVTGPF